MDVLIFCILDSFTKNCRRQRRNSLLPIYQDLLAAGTLAVL